jgi:hypothetical protein
VAGAAISIVPGAGNTTGAGGALTLTGGAGGSSSALGGATTLSGGTGGASNGGGGLCTVSGGAGAGTGTGGQVQINGGISASGTGGAVTIQTGNAAVTPVVTVQPNGFTRFGSGTASSTVHINGSFAAKVTSINTDTTADATTTVYVADASGGVVTVTLPLAANNPDRQYSIKKTDSSGNVVNVTASGADLIDGLATQAVSFQYESITVASDGTNWWII